MGGVGINHDGFGLHGSWFGAAPCANAQPNTPTGLKEGRGGWAPGSTFVAGCVHEIVANAFLGS